MTRRLSRMGWRAVASLGLLAGLSPGAGGVELQKKSDPQSAFTHVVVEETPFYTTGPQQGRPPDGRLQPGAKVTLLEEAGSYLRVRTDRGVVAYAAADALRKIGAAAPGEITDDLRAVARANNRFAFDLYGRLRAQEGSLFFSPASISTALAMTYAGAEGRTEKQMAEVLHFEIPEEQLHAGFGALTEILNACPSGCQVSMANRLWAQQGYAFRAEFLTVTRERYGAELAEVNFAQAEAARRKINAWAAEQTNGRIEDLIPPGVLDAMTRLVLTNAIYFKGAWEEEFTKDATQDAPFHLSPQQRIETPMMRQTENFRYAAADDLQILELPYAGGDLSMLVLLPKEIDGLAELERKLAAESLEQWTSELRRREVEVHLPRFKLTAQFTLSEALQAMGMELAFSEQADFTGISPAEDLLISEVVHKAFVDVNEEGTEAAAATGVVAAVPAAPVAQEPVVFRADRPFAFLIRDTHTQAVLFLGRVKNPKD